MPFSVLIAINFHGKTLASPSGMRLLNSLNHLDIEKHVWLPLTIGSICISMHSVQMSTYHAKLHIEIRLLANFLPIGY